VLALVLRVDVVEVGVAEEAPLHALVVVPLIARLHVILCSHHLKNNTRARKISDHLISLCYTQLSNERLNMKTEFGSFCFLTPRRLGARRHCLKRLPEAAPGRLQHPLQTKGCSEAAKQMDQQTD
jgi:hypothetical protein